MAGEPLVEPLVLDVQPAIDSLEPLAAALTELVAGFGQGIADAIANVSGVQPIPADQIIDGPGITDALVTAVSDTVPPPLIIDGDTTSLDSGIADALDQPRPPIEVDGDTTALTDAIDTATADTKTVPVEADTTQAQDAIDGLTAQPVTIPVEADTTVAQDAIDNLDTSIGTLGTSSTDTASKLGDLSSVTDLLSGAASAASGDATSLASGLGGVGLSTVAAGAGFLALGGFIDHTINLAAEGQAQNRLFASTFGDLATAVQSIHVDGLNISLSDLAKESGTVDSKLEASASRIGALGKSSGAAGDQIVKTTDQVLALGGTLSVTNPSLGDAADVTDRLTRLLATGGQRLAQYGVSLSSAQINAHALQLGLAATTAQLTPFDKLISGADLATQQFGTTLGLRFAAGSQNAQVQLRALDTAFQETLSSIGQPLLQPAIVAFTEFLPLVGSIGQALGALGQVALPVLDILGKGLDLLIGPIHLISDGLTGLASLPGPVAIGLALMGAAALEAAVPFAVLGTAADVLGAALDFATGPIGLTLIALTAIGAIFDSFGANSKQVAADTKTFTDALFGAASGATTLSGQMAVLNPNIQGVAAKLIEAAPAADGIRAAFDGVGGGAAGLSKALTGTQAEFDAYKKSVSAATRSNDPFFSSSQAVSAQLDDQRKALIASETEQAKALVSTNQLTQAQLDNLEATNKNSDGTENWSAILAQASLIADSTTASGSKLQAAQEGITTAVDAGQFSLKEASLAATAYGVSVQQATAIITDAEHAQDTLAAKTNIGTATYQKLVAQIAAGTLSIPDAEIAFQHLGFSIDGANTAVSDITTSINNFASSVGKGLPDISSALSTFEQNTTSDTSAVAAAVAKQKTVTDQVGVQLTNAADKLALAQDKTGKSAATAVKNAYDQLVLVGQKGKAAEDQAANDVLGATEKMFASAAPQNLIDQLKKNLTEIADFETNLKTIIKNGGGELAAEFAAQGPQIAAGQAAAFAADPKGTKISEGLINRGNAAKTDFILWAKSNFTPDVTNALENALGVSTSGAGGALTSDNSIPGAAGGLGDRVSERFKPDFTAADTAAIKAAENALGKDKSISEAAGTLGIHALLAYEAKFGPVSVSTAIQVALAGAAGTLSLDHTIPDAADAAAGKAADRYRPNFQGPVSKAVEAAAAKLAGDKSVTEAAGTAGLNALIGYEAKFGAVPVGQAVDIAMHGAQTALANNTDVPAKAKAKGQETTDAFGSNLDPASAASKAFGTAATTIAGLSVDSSGNSLVGDAGQLGHNVGEAFDTGIEQGISDPTSIAAIRAAGAAAGAAADAGARSPAGVNATSPSKKAIKTGQDFTAGLVVGIEQGAADAQSAAATVAASVVDQLHEDLTAAQGSVAPISVPFSADASGVQAQIAASIVSNGPVPLEVAPHVDTPPALAPVPVEVTPHLGAIAALAPVSVQVVPQFGAETAAAADRVSQSVIDRLQKQLQAGIAKAAAATAAKQALAQFVTSAAGQLPSIGSDISTFGQNIATATTNQSTALKDYHKQFGIYKGDLAQRSELEARAGQAQAVLQAAQLAYYHQATITPAKATAAQTSQLALARSAFLSAQSVFNGLERQLTSLGDKIVQQQGTIGTSAKTLSEANHALKIASDPEAFIKNITSQTATSKRFLADLTKLTKEGLTNLAKDLAASGPAAAGALADKLAAAPGKAKAAEAAIDQASAFAASFEKQIGVLFDPAAPAAKTATSAGAAVGLSFGTGIDQTVNTKTKGILDSVSQTAAKQAISIPFQPEVGDLHAQITSAALVHGPLAIDIAPRIAALAPLAPISVDVIPHLAVIPPLKPLHVDVIPHLLPLAGKVASAPGAIAHPIAGGPTTIDLNLTVVLDDGRQLQAAVTVPVPSTPAAGSRLTQLVRAEVHAS